MPQKNVTPSTCYQQPDQAALQGAPDPGHDHGHEEAHGSHGHGHEHPHGDDHARGHDHGHGHVHKPAPGQAFDRAFVLALIVTGGFAVVEVIGGWYAHSLALISDAGHMATDAAALFVGLLAARLARRPASVSKSYGYGRAEVIGAFVNGLTMLAVVVWIMVEAVSRALQPQPVAGLWVVGIAAAGLVVNLAVLVMLSHGHSTLNSRAAMLHVLGDLLGSVAAIVAGAVVAFTGWTLIDPLLSVAVALLILRSTWRLLMDSVNVLMEAVPPGVDYQAVERRLTTIHGVTALHDLHVWQMGSEGRALSAHLLISGHEQWPRVLEEARAVLRREFDVGHVTLQPVWPQLARAGAGRRQSEAHASPEGTHHAHEHGGGAGHEPGHGHGGAHEERASVRVQGKSQSA